MRRLHALLAAGLMTAPLGAFAGPRSDAPTAESEKSDNARLGIAVIGLTPELRKHFGAPEQRGVMVGRVQPKSAAFDAGISVGDILIEVKGAPVDSATDVLDALADAKRGDAVDIAVIRNGQPVTLSVTITEDAAPRSKMKMMKPRLPAWFDDWFDHFPDPFGRGGATKT